MFVVVLAVLAASMALGSCELLGSLFNEPPEVSIAFTSGDRYVYSDETVYLEAVMSDDDDDDLTYTWYLNGVRQDIDDTELYYTAPSASTDTTAVLSVTVSDGIDTAQASVTFEITASSTLIIYNDSGTSLYYFYMVPHPDGASGYWGSDLLGTSTISSGSSAKFIGREAGSYNLKWVYSGGATYTITTAAYFEDGHPRVLQLSNNTLLAAASYAATTAGSVSSEPGSRQVR